MSCIKCDYEPVETYVRVGVANIKIVGCVEHLKQLIEKLRKAKNDE